MSTANFDNLSDGSRLYIQISSIRQGAQTAWPSNLPTVTFQQQNLTQAEFDDLCGEVIAPFQAVNDTFAAWQAALKARDAAIAGAQRFVAGVYGILPQMFGADSAELAKYGAPEKKQRAPLTSEQKVNAANKAKATRLARGTMSKKAKSKIHGTPPVPESPPQTGA
jgi:hypothetical protein